MSAIVLKLATPEIITSVAVVQLMRVSQSCVASFSVVSFSERTVIRTVIKRNFLLASYYQSN